MKKLALAVAALSIFSCTKIEEFQGSNPASNMGLENAGTINEVVPNELLIQFKEGTTETGKANILRALGASVKEQIYTNAMKRFGKKEGVFLITSNMNALEAKARLAGNEVIDFVEPNYVYQTSLESNDLYNFSLWGLNASFGINAPALWGTTTGSSKVVIGIIDEGVMITHEDLSANIGTTKEIANGIDDDGNK